MFDRGATAGRAWCSLVPGKPATLAVLPRARVASKSLMSERTTLVGEMEAILNALSQGTRVELVSVGVDALTTAEENFTWLNTNWSHLSIAIVIIVPATFPGSKKTFPLAENGIRYGVFELSLLAAAIPAIQAGQPCGSRYKELLRLLESIRNAKKDTDVGAKVLVDLTVGRANFRVCPDSEWDSGVDESQRKSRKLHQGDVA